MSQQEESSEALDPVTQAGTTMASNRQPATDRISRMREILNERCRYSYECGLSICITMFFMLMFGLVTYWFIAFISIEMNEGGGINSTTGTNVTTSVNTREGDFLVWDGTKLVWGYHTTPSNAVISEKKELQGGMQNNTVSPPGIPNYNARSLNDRNPSAISWLYNTPTSQPAPTLKNDLQDNVRDEREKLLAIHEILYDAWATGGGNEKGGSILSFAQETGKYMRNKNNRRKREAGRRKYDEYYGLGLDKMEDPRHPHQTNKWYADMSATAKQTTNESCYVCSLIPHASGTPKVLLPKELPIIDAQCLLHLTLCRIKNTFQAHEVTFQMLQNEKTCYPKTAGVVCLKEPFFVIQGTLFSDNKWKDEEVMCKAEALRGVTPEKLQWIEETCTPVWKEHISKLTWVTAIEKPFKLQSEIDYGLCFKGEGKTSMGTNKNCNKTLTIPDLRKGTAALMDTYWVCGNQAYLHLPPSWSGSCSMATLHSALMVIPESHIDGNSKTPGRRQQSAAQPTAESQMYVLSSGNKGEMLNRNKRASNYI
ncbi:methyltransferase N6AMT1 isoform X1 [Ambystoma mexicanum]|uniref:methyltransferase N6AMT1 isoform X1 n=1 Tax=Ambystoma mexicanum TaxID=8296 RepID=UPI0037E91B35